MKQIINEFLKRLYIQNKSVYLWFRDDDVGRNTIKFKKMARYFDNRDISILLAVIPTLIDEEITCFIKNSDRLMVGQHGFSHTNYADDNEPKSEYPNSRCNTSTISEIMLGKDIIKTAFQEKFLDVFIPPYFEIDKQILQKIDGRFKWYSGWWTNSIAGEFVFVNAQIDFIKWDGNNTFGGAEFVESQFIRELIKLEESTCYSSIAIGIVLHHEHCEEDSYKELDWIVSLTNLHKNLMIISPSQAYDFVTNDKVVVNHEINIE